MELNFQAPPEKTRHTTLQTEMEEVVDALSKHPGEWALVYEGLTQSNTAQRARRFREFDNIEAVNRNGGVYVRFIGAPESDDSK